jgi:nucleotidyltransferase substrate binding protein (TIGR01987 family)
MELDLTALRKATGALDRALNAYACNAADNGAPTDLCETLRAGVVQTFEVVYELCWKFMRRRLAMDVGAYVVEGLARRQLFRLAGRHGLIADVGVWSDYHEARDLTSHTYNAEVADKVAELAPGLLRDANALVLALEARDA